MRSLVPPAHAAVPAVACGAHPVFAPDGEHSLKKALLTLTGLFFESNEMLSGVPLLYAADLRNAMNESLNGLQTYSGHSPDPKSKSNENPFAFFGTLMTIWKSTTSCTAEPVCEGQPVALFGYPVGAVPCPVIAQPNLNDVPAMVEKRWLVGHESMACAYPELNTENALPSRGAILLPNVPRMLD